MRKFLFILLFVLLGIGFLIGYAASPYLFKHEFASSNVVKFNSPSPSPPKDKSTSGGKEERNKNRIKVVTYNIGYAWGDKNNQKIHPTQEEVEKNLHEMANVLKKLDADILCLQEVDFQSARTFDINQFEFLARALRIPYGAYVITWNKRYLPWPYWPPKAHYGHIVSGQAILSRFPLENQSLFKFEKPASNPFWYNWFYLDRIVQKVSVKLGSKKLALWNVHLEAFDPKTRFSQTEILADQVNEEKNLLKIVAGDFNTSSLSLSPLRKAEGVKIFYTMPSWNPTQSIDHLFYHPFAFKLEGVGIVPHLLASDHLPVWGIFGMVFYD